MSFACSQRHFASHKSDRIEWKKLLTLPPAAQPRQHETLENVQFPSKLQREMHRLASDSSTEMVARTRRKQEIQNTSFINNTNCAEDVSARRALLFGWQLARHLRCSSSQDHSIKWRCAVTGVLAWQAATFPQIRQMVLRPSDAFRGAPRPPVARTAALPLAPGGFQKGTAKCWYCVGGGCRRLSLSPLAGPKP